MIDQKYCPCGGIILADSEDWETPVCNAHFEALGQPIKEPTGVPIRFLFQKEESPEETAPTGNTKIIGPIGTGGEEKSFTVTFDQPASDKGQGRGPKPSCEDCYFHWSRNEPNACAKCVPVKPAREK